MKRFAPLLVALVLFTPLIGCGSDAPPPAGTPGTGPDTGPGTVGEAAKDKAKRIADMDARAKSKPAGKAP